MNRFFSYIITVFSFFACKNGESTAQSKLPSQRPADLKIEMHEGGGMLPESQGMFISQDSSYYEYHFYQAHNKVYFEMSSRELDDLYQQLIHNQLDKIKTEDRGTVHDRGGESITLTFNGYKDRVSVGSSGGIFIAKKWLENYKNCLKVFEDLKNRKMTELKIPFTIELDKSITESGKLIGINISDTQYNYYSEQSGIKPKQTLNLLRGNHNLVIHLTESTLPIHERKNFTYLNFNFDVQKEKPTLLIRLEGKDLKWELK